MPAHSLLLAHGKKCAQCGSTIECNALSNKYNCWCTALPTLFNIKNNNALCHTCLAPKVALQIKAFISTHPLNEQRTLAAQCSNEGELVPFIDYTVENGLWVFSSWYHLKRGNCCGNGCIHCPY